MMGGRFRSVMPSNLVYPGACAIESLPAPGSEYASHAAKGELRRLFARSVPPSLGAIVELCSLHSPLKTDIVDRAHIPPTSIFRDVKSDSCA